MNLSKILKESIKKSEEIFCDSAKSELSVNSLDVTISRSNGKIVIDGYVVNDIRIDQYNNLNNCSIPKPFSVEYLPKFGRILVEIFEHEDSFRGRANVGFYIDYFEKYSDKLTLDDLSYMFKTGKTKDGSFREWLIGTSYSSDGNLPRKYKFTKDQLTKL